VSDTTADSPESGLYEKYTVRKDGKEVENCFVLEPESDPAAREALWTYIDTTDNDELAEELREWLLRTVGDATEQGGESGGD